MDQAWLKDSAERIVWTFVQASIAAVGSEALAVAIVDADVSVLRGAAVAGIAAVLAAVKAIAAKRIGDPDSASTLRPVVTSDHPLPGFVHYDPDSSE